MVSRAELQARRGIEGVRIAQIVRRPRVVPQQVVTTRVEEKPVQVMEVKPVQIKEVDPKPFKVTRPSITGRTGVGFDVVISFATKAEAEEFKRTEGRGEKFEVKFRPGATGFVRTGPKQPDKPRADVASLRAKRAAVAQKTKEVEAARRAGESAKAMELLKEREQISRAPSRQFFFATPKELTLIKASEKLAQIRVVTKKLAGPTALGSIAAKPSVAKGFRIDPFVPGIIVPKPSKELVAFERAVEAQKKRSIQFFRPKAFKRVEALAGIITGGLKKTKEGDIFLLPKEERGFIARRAQSLIATLAVGPVAFGGAVAEAGEKAFLTLKAPTVPEIKKEDITKELFIKAPKRVVSQFKGLSFEEKLDVGIFATVTPLIGSPTVARFVERVSLRKKAIQKLTPSEKAKLERFELSVAELKGVRLVPKALDLVEVGRLSPKAAKALQRVIERKKSEVVVGGSVAQRTQIKGKSRIPEDVDLFTSGNPKKLIQEIKSELELAGVKRVSAVRGKQITIEGKKSIEVKELSLLKENIRRVQGPFQLISRAFVKTPKGIRVLRLGAQAQRKVIGGFGLELARRRPKDITDLPTILRSLRVSKRGTSELFPSIKISPKRPRISPLSSLLRESRIKRFGPTGISILAPRRPPSALIPGRPPSILFPGKPPSALIPGRPTPSVLPPGAPPSALPPGRPPSIITPGAPPSVITPGRPPPRTAPPRIPPTIIKFPVSAIKRRIDKFITQRSPSFDVQIRRGEKRGDRFVTVAKNLPTNIALQRLTRSLDTFIEASGRLKPNKRKPRTPDNIFAPNLARFRPPKKGSRLPSNTIIEKRRFRLSSPQEKQQISFFRKLKARSGGLAF